MHAYTSTSTSFDAFLIVYFEIMKAGRIFRVLLSARSNAIVFHCAVSCCGVM